MARPDYSFDELREGLIRSLGLEFNRVCGIIDKSYSAEIEDWSRRVDNSHALDWKVVVASATLTGGATALGGELSAIWGSACAAVTFLYLGGQSIRRHNVRNEIMNIVHRHEFWSRQIPIPLPQSRIYPFGDN